jgi:glucose-6-phosphate isomerase
MSHLTLSHFHPTISFEQIAQIEKVCTKAWQEFLGQSKVDLSYAQGVWASPLQKQVIAECEKTYQKFSTKKKIVQFGMGGSLLGAKALVYALGKKYRNRFQFIDNIGPDSLFDFLEEIRAPEDYLFYFASKSGNTIETLALFSVIKNWLLKRNVSQESLKDMVVFATCESAESYLFQIAKLYQITTLIIPPNIGGRFSLMTATHLFPARFAQIDLEQLFLGAQRAQTDLLENPQKVIQLATHILAYKQFLGINQTVLMPYSGKLKYLTEWFIQLWAESLGKLRMTPEEKIHHEGLTPLGATGVTDQHAQLQLFLDGPLDKYLLFIHIKNFRHDFDFSIKQFGRDQFQTGPLHSSMAKLLEGCLLGALDSFQKVKRPYTLLQIEELNEFTFGQIIFYFEILTILVGQSLDINPFNQPGVENSKNFVRNWPELRAKISK